MYIIYIYMDIHSHILIWPDVPSPVRLPNRAHNPKGSIANDTLRVVGTLTRGVIGDGPGVKHGWENLERKSMEVL
jgi:hypothetical protein